jgi:acylphosphatase
MAMIRRVRFRVSGRVQGVAYRASAVDAAVSQGCVGWVRNLTTGDVDGIVQGEASAVDGFLAWAAKGPSGARVDRLLTDDEEVADDFNRFEIRR